MNRIGFVLVTGALAASGMAADIDEFKVKREAVFEFSQKPAVTRDGDKVTVAFESKGLCDVTVAIEDGEGRIVRHLVSGVLGPKAPEPLQKDSKKQAVVWDGKDDRGVYVDDKGSCTVRVSLGLKPRFERTLYWSPHKRISNPAPLLAATPEGVYVVEGTGVDHLRLFDHAGQYVRTIYPFPGDKVGQVVGLQTQVFPQDGQALPLKVGYERATLLTSGSSGGFQEGGHAGGSPATAMAVWQDRIALAYQSLNRLSTNGASGSLPIKGPKVSFVRPLGKRSEVVGPTSIAFSPAGKLLYLTGYVWKQGLYNRDSQCFHVVRVMDYEKQDEPRVFLGVEKTDEGFGSGNDQFCVPLSVDCDAQGRVYVADYGNSRIQVFSPEGRHLKTLAVPFPAAVKVDRATGEIWAFSGVALGVSPRVEEAMKIPEKLKPSVCRLGTFEQPVAAEPQALPMVEGTGRGGWDGTGGQVYQVALDTHAGEPTLWIVGRQATIGLAEAQHGGTSLGSLSVGWDARGIRLIRRQEGQWGFAADFGAIARKKVPRTTPPQFSRIRLYVNPADQMLTIAEEQTGVGKSFYSVLRCDPETGRMKEVKFPFDPEDIAFDLEGLAYFRTDREVVRFAPKDWREVPWDYGEIRQDVGFDTSGSTASYDAVAALPIPGHRPVWWSSSGMGISPKRHLAVTCNIPDRKPEANPKDRRMPAGAGRKYTPMIYPGRAGACVIPLFDEHGKVIIEDAVPGMTNADGVGIDKDDNLYVMVAASRLIDGKRCFDPVSETLMKFRPGKAKFISSGEALVPLPAEAKPNRPADVWKYGMGETWVEGAEWMYGGVGYGGQGGSCVCWHSRFQLDDFARSFVPEVLRFNVAVLDSNGNVILRIGRYGNVDDGEPLVPEGGPSSPRSIGGDEVALAHAAYVGVHTDRRLYIHDAGNARILSVKLGYHAEEKVALKDVPDRGGK